MSSGPRQSFQLGDFTFNTLERRLYERGRPVPLGGKAADVLALLLQRPNEVVDKDELIRALWPDTAVEENNLNQQISAIRKALGESAGQPRYIVTAPGRGYRLVLPAAALNALPSAAPPAPSPADSPPGAQPAGPSSTPWPRLPWAVMLLLGCGLAAALVLSAPWRSTGDGAPPPAQARPAPDVRITHDPDAHAAYLKSRYFWNHRTEDGYLKAIEYAQAAVKRDPAFARAYAAMADGYALLGSRPTKAISRADAMNRAREAAVRALELDGSLAEALTSLAFVKMHYDWEWQEAGRLFERALAADPGYATAHHWYAFYLTALRRHDEAVAEIKRARELDPLSVIIATDVAELLHYAGREQEAMTEVRGAIELNPRFTLAHRLVAWSHMRQGQYDRALKELEPLAQTPETATDVLPTIGHLHGRLGNVPAARQIIGTLERQLAGSSELPIVLSVVHAGLGEHDAAFRWLDEAARARSGSLILLLVEPLWEPLRTDPRYRQLARRVGLVGESPRQAP